MIYTILVALDADPLLPRCRFTGLADLVLRWLSMIYETRVTRVKARFTCEGIIYLSEAERIHSTHSTHSIHAGEARSEADSERWPRIRG